MIRNGLLALASATLLGACAQHGTRITSASDMTDRDTASAECRPDQVGDCPAQDLLLATTWVQSSLEFQALNAQIWRQAGQALERVLAQAEISAAPEQQQQDVSGKPPALIVDVDETLLDNSPYQARLVFSDRGFEGPTWTAWVMERQADAVAGAVEFLQQAARLGVTVFYVTNRSAEECPATEDNLRAHGFPIQQASVPVMLCMDPDRGWGSAKGTRRELIAADYRIVMMAGDNLGDFHDDYRGTPEQRAAASARYQDWWGERWIVLPNPMYGSWNDSLIGFDRSIDAEGRREAQRAVLKPKTQR